MMRSHATALAGLLALVASALSCHAGDLLNGTTTGNPPVVARQLKFTTQPGSVASGAPVSTVRVSALDSSGALAPRYSGAITVSLAANPGSGTLTGTLSETAVNGVATFADLHIDKPGTGYTLRAVASGLNDATSQAFDVTLTQPPPPPPATQLRFTVQPPQSTPAGQMMAALSVSALDATGAVVTTFSGGITVLIGTNPSGGTLSGTQTVSATNGVATFSTLSINKAGSGYTLQATSPSLTSTTSSTFDITATPPPPPPPATQLRFTVQPASTQAGQTIAPPVQVSALDASGTLVTSFTGAITVAIGTNPANGTLSGTLTVNATNGVATFSNLSINNAGTGYTLQATSSGLTSATSSAFNVTAPPPPPATQLRFTVQPTNTLPLTTITPAVEVAALDAQGNPVSGFAGTITIAIGHDASLLGNAVLSGTLSVTAVNGVARFSDLSIDEVGLGYTLRATVTGLTSAVSAPFDVATP
ncbi:MAG TPA: hypothetical protein VNG35_03725 [Gemmatimonadales bacterium]|nr:hypothetical protein [Gemmatimonadales bacterium]